jgi:hypothetical protein
MALSGAKFPPHFILHFPARLDVDVCKFLEAFALKIYRLAALYAVGTDGILAASNALS